jgi:MarR family 2-MHQ and catechol resistance regulon transcriptional repressor
MEKGTHIRLVLWKAERAVERIDLESIADTGHCPSDFAIMEALLHKGALPIGEIGGKVLLTSGSMTAAVNRLERTGYVKRIKRKEDARRCEVTLTPAGRRVIKTAYSKHEKSLEKVAEVLTAAERRELVRLLKKIGHHAARIALGKTNPRKRQGDSGDG